MAEKDTEDAVQNEETEGVSTTGVDPVTGETTAPTEDVTSESAAAAEVEAGAASPIAAASSVDKEIARDETAVRMSQNRGADPSAEGMAGINGTPDALTMAEAARLAEGSPASVRPEGKEDWVPIKYTRSHVKPNYDRESPFYSPFHKEAGAEIDQIGENTGETYHFSLGTSRLVHPDDADYFLNHEALGFEKGDE